MTPLIVRPTIKPEAEATKQKRRQLAKFNGAKRSKKS